jgi:hypothetical protein
VDRHEVNVGARRQVKRSRTRKSRPLAADFLGLATTRAVGVGHHDVEVVAR